MNREQRRKLKKSLPRGISKEDFSAIVEMREAVESGETIKEGTKVRLDYDKIVSDVNHSRKTEKYKALIEDLKDKVCTVKYDEKYGNKPILVCLEEDPNEPKYLWYIKDLVVVKEENQEKKSTTI